MASITATPNPVTGSVLVQVEQTLARDLFTRVVANGWGNSTTGQPWTVTSGVVGDFSVNGTQGLHSVNTLNASRITQITPGTGPDMGATISTSVPVVASGAPINSFLLLRYIDNSNFYYAQLRNNVGVPPTLIIGKRVGSSTDITLASFELPNNWAAGATFFIRFDVCGSRLRAKAWRNTVAEPDWMIQISDWDLPSGGNVGVRSQLATGNTNVTPVVFTYDNFYSYVSQPVRVVRVTPDGVESEVRGSPLNTNAPTAASATATATLWDNEAPFDTNLVYRLYSSCTPTTIIVSSATIQLNSDGFGWLRDPTDPTKNLLITIEEFYDECVDQDVIVFSGLGDREYTNASGQFDIINAQRPRTVSQTRKNYASSLTLTSFSLDDILDLEDIYAPGTVLSLTLPTLYGWANRTYGTDYITIGDIVSVYIGVDQRVTSRVWTMPFRLSGPPVDTDSGGTGGNGIGGGGATYDELADSVLGTTYNTLTASAQTYDQVAAGVGY